MEQADEQEFLESGKIEIKMQLNLGRVLKLEKNLVAVDAPSRQLTQTERFLQIRKSPGPQPADGSSQPVEERTFEYLLTESEEELVLQDEALARSFTIFGVPGMGKTNLLMNMLEQFMAHEDRETHRYGALIVDPKGAIADDVESVARQTRRSKDLVRIDAIALQDKEHWVNIIDCGLDSASIGLAILMAGKANGLELADGYWLMAGENLIGATHALLSLVNKRVPTLRTLFEVVGDKRLLEQLITAAERHGLAGDAERDARLHISKLQMILEEPRTFRTVSTALGNAFGVFRESAYQRYSKEYEREQVNASGFYDAIVDEGKIVMVSPAPQELKGGPLVCAIIKSLFQACVGSRLTWVRTGRLRNYSRPVLMMIDEYSDVASDQEGRPFGDVSFVQKARAVGCGCIFATQSKTLLEESGLTKVGVQKLLGLMAGYISLRLRDTPTVEEIEQQVGDEEVIVTTRGSSEGEGGRGSSVSHDKRDRSRIPKGILTSKLEQGQALFTGAIDKKAVRTEFVQTRLWRPIRS